MWHRAAVGGLWDVIGPLQLEFLRSQGLESDDYLLDVGCGSLRAGLHFVRYLDPGHYLGMDVNRALLEAGQGELERAGLGDREAVLLVDGDFRFGRFGHKVEMAIAQSVFTHISFNSILRCLGEMEQVLVPGGRFFATFFENAHGRLDRDPIEQCEHGTTYCDRNPYHYDPDALRWAVEGSSLDYELIGDWGHPRNQKMAVFTKQE